MHGAAGHVFGELLEVRFKQYYSPEFVDKVALGGFQEHYIHTFLVPSWCVSSPSYYLEQSMVKPAASLVEFAGFEVPKVKLGDA